MSTSTELTVGYKIAHPVVVIQTDKKAITSLISSKTNGFKFINDLRNLIIKMFLSVIITFSNSRA